MKYYGKVSSKGQITIPADVRKELGIKPEDRVEIVLEDGAAMVRKARSILDSAGKYKPLIPGLSIAEMIEIAHEEQYLEKLRRESGD